MYGKHCLVCSRKCRTCKVHKKLDSVEPLLKDTVNEGHNINGLHTKDKFDHQMDFAIVLTHVLSLKSGGSLYSEQNGCYQCVLY